ncbi:MAG TPA: ABC transporter ATP-binding protein [Alphaproteobacteria bacterium]|nr:ABC transporter ATP-binding protein [Alphaproteobacteria bacterium]
MTGLSLRLEQAEPIPLAAELAVAPGELLSLVGPSGSGKTTILRCIAGLHRPLKGHIACGGAVWFDGAKAINLPPQRRPVGLVFQNYALFPHLTALENVATALGHLRREARPDRARALLSRVHLSGLEGRRPAELSGGQQQRVAVARALAREPQVLLLDEPFSAVDQVTRRKLQRELADLRRGLSIPMILVTHDLEEAAMLADRLALLHHGQTLQTGTPEEILTRPKNALVATLVATRNIFEGRILGQLADRKVTLLDWRGRKLEATFAPQFADGEKISWTIPPSEVILHRRVQPSRGIAENPITGIILDQLRLGSLTSFSIRVPGEEQALIMDLPNHVAWRNGLAPGIEIGVSLLAKAIHIMPAQ